MKIQASEIELVSIDSLIPHPKNIQEHSPEQIDRLIKLIEYQGMRNPIVVQRGTNLIVAGHGRTMALKKMGQKQVPVIYQEFDSEAQLYAYMVSDNAIGKDAWVNIDLSMVNQEMLDLGPDFDIDMLGLKDFVIEPMEGELPDLSAQDPDCQRVTFVLSNEQKDLLDEAMEKAKKSEDCSDEINQNSNGNTLAAILRRYVHG